MSFHHCTIQEILSYLDELYKDSPEHTDLIQNKINELLGGLLKRFKSESKPQNIALDYAGAGCWKYKNANIGRCVGL